ncbi:DUF5347 family protein [Pantoea agglomerans pv. betae]|jgi:hypothetical protein|uniref:DUF5347 family protein n=1 Tax=Enterobacter agglomerans TaxID=549 RepID=UPI0007E5B3E0|nr:DUF5347 family protein [Pantoea agglomerans]WHU85809.1 DUF5347 family protein [Pantoea agglomerans pv. betae]
MAIEGDSMLVELTAGQRVAALNHVALLRAQLMGGNCEKDVARFIAEMRDVTDNNYQDNKRALSAIFFLANIGKDRHSANFTDLTNEERNALIRAMNHLKVVVSFFPKHMTLSN